MILLFGGGLKTRDALSLKCLQERMKEDVWNSADKSTQSSRNRMSLTGREPISIFPYSRGWEGGGGREGTYRLILTALLAQVWWKSEPPQLRLTSRITLNTSGDRGCQTSGKTPGSDGCSVLPICLLHLTAYQVSPGDFFLIISY